MTSTRTLAGPGSVFEAPRVRRAWLRPSRWCSLRSPNVSPVRRHPLTRVATSSCSPPPARVLGVIVALICVTWCGATKAGGNPAPPFSARAGLDIATNAAHSWAGDARLVYLENDEAVGPDGSADRWGYLFYSEHRGRARGYSVRDGELDEASDLDFELDAPPVSDEWIDSGAALAAAEKKAGSRYCIDNGGRLATMLLIRGAFHEQTPNATTWAIVYTSPTAPTLFVVVDAAKGDVVRMWRG